MGGSSCRCASRATMGARPSASCVCSCASCAARSSSSGMVRPSTAGKPSRTPRERRVVYKAEEVEKGSNLRFVVTSRTDLAPLALYNWYVRRGEPELWIKDLKDACFADRLSCHRFWANQFRLLLHAAAYWLLDSVRRALMRAGTAPMRLASLRLRRLNIVGSALEPPPL